MEMTKNDNSESDRKFYSDREKILLMSLVEKFKHVLENKKTDGTNLQKKNAAWRKIHQMYNLNDVFPRTEKQLKKLWDNLKQRTRKIDSNNKKSCIETGGGPPPPEDKDPLNEMVRSIVPTIGLEIDNPWDSTSMLMAERKQINNEYKETLDCEVVEMDTEVAKCATLFEQSPASSWQCMEKADVAKDITEERVNNENGNTSIIMGERKHLPWDCATPRFNSKKARALDEEASLRITKIKRSIEQQEELHKMKMEAAEAEKNYWVKRTQLLN